RVGDDAHQGESLVAQPDRPAGRGRRLRPSPVAEVAEAEGLPVLKPKHPRGEEFQEELRLLRPDISVVVAYGHILRPEILELPPHGSWNVHASLLPELRGAAPIHWAIARGYETTGITIMRMTEGMDTGPILHQVEEAIDPSDTSTQLSLRLAELGARALIEGLAFLEYGDREPREQDHARATYAPKVSRQVARIDWSRSARELDNHVRAMDEVPGAWTLWEGEPLKLFSPSTAGPEGAADLEEDEAGVPGTVVRAEPDDGGSLAVLTGDGVVWFQEVQPAGKRRMPVAAWLRGRGAEAGQRFE
ncbi:MAG: methionyl-tRNA formyltransferase, partial [Gemmatimonadota bacterium]